MNIKKKIYLFSEKKFRKITNVPLFMIYFVPIDRKYYFANFWGNSTEKKAENENRSPSWQYGEFYPLSVIQSLGGTKR